VRVYIVIVPELGGYSPTHHWFFKANKFSIRPILGKYHEICAELNPNLQVGSSWFLASRHIDVKTRCL
jgi:hypothetical protein